MDGERKPHTHTRRPPHARTQTDSEVTNTAFPDQLITEVGVCVRFIYPPREVRRMHHSLSFCSPSSGTFRRTSAPRLLLSRTRRPLRFVRYELAEIFSLRLDDEYISFFEDG